MTLQSGLSAEFEIEIARADTAVALGSGDLPVLGTPRVVALVEQATVRAVAGHLAHGQTSLGVEVVVHHRRPTLPGARIVVSARLVDLDGERLSFQVAVHEMGTLVADGTVSRVVVDGDKFLNRAESRSATKGSR